MAFVSDFYGLQSSPSFRVALPFHLKGIVRFAAMATGAIMVAGCMVVTLGMVEAVLPAFMPLAPVMRRLPAKTPQQLTVVDQKIGMGHAIRQGFIQAYTADAPYSNLDWRRNNLKDADIIADIGPEAVIEASVEVPSQVVEPREERVTPFAQVQFVVSPDVIDTAANAAQYASRDFLALDKIALPAARVTPVPSINPAAKIADASVVAETAVALPGVVPFPGNRPRIKTSESPKQPQLAYAPANGQTEDVQRGLVQRLFGHTARNKTAIYDISAATVYMPNGEKLEAHSGIGYMRDNPKFVDQKMRGATPPSTYNLRMRESLFHGVEAVRLLPANGRNPHNRDGLLAHTYMLRRPGDSNGCVVFKDYARFLRAFKRGEIDKMIVVESSSNISNKRYM
ncbi:DUF2778 domain-containing protein [Brucella gallinifaecis]|uniref:DUF2778 domain-containing protein n=1 Tax=Brucella gallinifaecis TaxID=215590 RepID=UPI00235E06A0|nr:DUF2778 domain-containing protein [Brucella gallinifaecis]